MEIRIIDEKKDIADEPIYREPKRIEILKETNKKNHHKSREDNIDLDPITGGEDLVIDICEDLSILTSNAIKNRKIKMYLYRMVAVLCTFFVYISAIALMASVLIPPEYQAYVSIVLGIIVLLNKGIVSFLHPKRNYYKYREIIPKLEVAKNNNSGDKQEFIDICRKLDNVEVERSIRIV